MGRRRAQEEVFLALADARMYPRWWKPTYRAVEADGPPAVGCRSHHKFKAKLPYTLSTTSTIVRLDPPHEVEAQVDGDLRGRGVWTLTPRADRIHVRFDWRVFADRPLLPILARPASARLSLEPQRGDQSAPCSGSNRMPRPVRAIG